MHPTLTFSGGGGFFETGGPGTATITKPAGLTGNEGIIASSFTTTGDFDARLIFDDSQLGSVGLLVAAYDDVLGFPSSTTSSPGADIFYYGPTQFQSIISKNGGGQNFGVAGPGPNPVTFDIPRTGQHSMRR